MGYSKDKDGTITHVWITMMEGTVVSRRGKGREGEERVILHFPSESFQHWKELI